nr:helix-turn-helix domain-containing protein [Marinifilum caeruleilacunae]
MEEAVEKLSRKHFYPLEERWLDNQEVCQTLLISKRTLQTYRDNGTLPFSQIGSKIYYKSSDIQAHLDKNYIQSFK